MHSSAAVADINFCTNIFDGLVALDENGQVVPKLATDWVASEDGLHYTFHLREGVKFHNGNDFTADDVKLSVERFRDESWMQFASFAVDSCDIVDDYTVTINLKYAYGNFLNMLWYCAIIDSDHYSSMSEEEFARNPVGTGPFKFAEWTPRWCHRCWCQSGWWCRLWYHLCWYRCYHRRRGKEPLQQT